MAKIRHIAITAEDPFVTAELMKQAFGLEEIGRGDSDLAREVYLTDPQETLDPADYLTEVVFPIR